MLCGISDAFQTLPQTSSYPASSPESRAAATIQTYNVIMSCRANLIRIGNSRGIRIPKALLDQAGLGNRVPLRAEKGRLVVVPDNKPRDGWEEAFAASVKHEVGEREPLNFANDFDREEWTW